MSNQNKSFPLRYLLLALITIGSVGAVLFYILYCTKGLFNSDMAYWLLLADEQRRTGQFYPEGFYYTTGVPLPMLSSPVICSFLRFFCNNMILCRELTILIVSAGLFLLIALFYRTILGSDHSYLYAWISITLLCLPMMQYPQTFYEGAYAWQSIWELLLMIIFFHITLRAEFKKERSTILWLLAFFFVLFFNSMGLRTIMILCIPFTIAFLFMQFQESDYHFEKVFATKRIKIITILSFIAIILGFISYFILAKTVSLSSTSAGMTFVGHDVLFDNFKTFLTNVFYYYSAVNATSLFSITGITTCLNFVILVICAFISPIWALVHYWKEKRSFLKFYTIYAWLSNFFVIYFMIFTTANHYGYFRHVYWHNLVFTTLFLVHIMKKHDKYYEWIIIICLGASVCCGHLNYFVQTVRPIHAQYIDEKQNGTLVDYLEENDLTYGFATFWNAYNNRILSNGKIELAAYLDVPNNPYLWMTSASYYDVSLHPGKCFLLIAPGETVDQKFYQAASEIKEYKNYKILVYEKNLLLYDELR